MSETLVTGSQRPSLLASVVGLAVIVALLAAGLVVAVRARDNAGAAASATGLVMVGMAAVAVAAVPISLFGFAPSHQVLWLWPLGAFVTLAVLMPLTANRGGPLSGAPMLLLTVLALMLGALNIPSMNARLGPADSAETMPAVRELVSELAPLRAERGVLVDLREQRFAEPYSAPVMLQLERLGVTWFVDDPGQLRQVGDRAYEGDASVRLFIREGDAAREAPPGADRIAYAEGPGDMAVAVYTVPLVDG
jgi:hypothetical protein